MLSNFLQKPLGIVTVLTAAVGGPYAAFETDIGTSLRRALINGQSFIATNNARSSDATTARSDPFSLLAAGTSNGQTSWPGTAPSTPQSGIGQATPQSGIGQVSGSSWSGSGWTSDRSAPSGQVVSTVYGPATVYPIGPGTQFPNASSIPQSQYPKSMPQSVSFGNLSNPISVSNPTLETRSGSTAVVPGGTDQLWDYTIGAPSLPQIQQQPQTAVGGGNVSDLREVLRFDIVPGWLPQRFARVTTITSNVQMDGLRVPLITGTQSTDIAGSLTYYFDANQSLKRINLQGLSGDPTNLANLMVQYYQLKPEQSLGGQLFTARWNNRVTSVMQIAPAPIIYAGADHSKYIIFLELNQPSSQYALSDDASEILRTSQATQRW